MNIKLFDYKLPPDLIAQKQAKPRDSSRLLVLDRASGRVRHECFYDLVDHLDKNDVLVINQTKVFPARLLGKKGTGGKVECLLISRVNGSAWQAMVGGRHLKVGDKLYFNRGLVASIVKDIDTKVRLLKFNKNGSNLDKIISQIGHTPLPPYIKVKDSNKIKKDYQTIFAKKFGSAAAPTAGLHFTPRLLEKLKAKGIKIYKITLHVGLGTFAPVEVEDIKAHKIHKEWAEIDKATAQSLNRAKAQGKNIVAVGTTTARTLEAMSDKVGHIKAQVKWVDIYIYPGYKFRFVDDLITNFHLPKSSLLFMVSALAGRKRILQAYKKAIKLKYRFFSFGDAMFVRHSSTRMKSE